MDRAFGLPFWGEVWYNGGDMVGLAQMVRASDCGPEGRWFDPSIPPHVIQLGDLGCLVEICECSTAVSMQVFQT